MAASIEPQTPEEDAALRTSWHDWLLDTRDLGWLAFFVVNALGGLDWLAWSLSSLREEEAIDRRWTLQDVRWRARDCAWHIDAAAMDERRGGGARSR